MYKGWKLLTMKERKHLKDNGIYNLYGCTTNAIEALAKSHRESPYPLCDECKRILTKLGYMGE